MGLFFFLGRSDIAASIFGSSTHVNDDGVFTGVRKKSRDESSVHPDMLTATLHEETTGERKTSASSSHSKGKEREKSEGNICFAEDKVLFFFFFLHTKLSNVVEANKKNVL